MYYIQIHLHIELKEIQVNNLQIDSNSKSRSFGQAKAISIEYLIHSPFCDLQLQSSDLH